MYYLKDDVYFEPLINHWYAWTYLIPPLTAARYIEKSHKRLMLSFINNYELHILANKEKLLTGGEFLNCDTEQVAEIKLLVKHIENNLKAVTDVSKAIEALDNMLRNHKTGGTLENLYSQIPSVLQGYIELAMDLNCQPAFRMIEGLLYKSGLYQESLQSISLGSVKNLSERPFVFSTPRLPDENHLQLELAFNHPLLDQILAARTTPISEDVLNEFENVIPIKGSRNLRDFFTKEPSKHKYIPLTSSLRVQYLGHAGFLLETSNHSILIDPVIACRDESNENKVKSFSDLPPVIDFICITHNHQDHANLESLLQLRHKTNKVLVPKNNGGSLADPSLKLILQKLNFQVIEFDEMEELLVPDGKIVSIPFLGEHGDLNIRSKCAWYFELCGKKLLFGADSSNLDPILYKNIESEIGQVDILALGMECIGAPYTWLYGALHTMKITKVMKESRRLNGADFIQAKHMIETFGPQEVLIYAMGMEPWYKYFMGIEYDPEARQIEESDKLIEFCSEQCIPANRLFGHQSWDY